MLRAEKNRRAVKAVAQALEKDLISPDVILKHLRLQMKKKTVKLRKRSEKTSLPA